MECSKLNILIGEPNTGKSNILESLGLISSIPYDDVTKFIRFENLVNLFNDLNIDNDIEIQFDKYLLGLRYSRDEFISYTTYAPRERSRTRVYLKKYDYFGTELNSELPRNPRLARSRSEEIKTVFDNVCFKIKYYNYNDLSDYGDRSLKFLLPPFGENMSSISITNNELKNIINNIYERFNYKFVIEEPERKIKIFREEGSLILLFPFKLISDTLKRIVFYLSAICSNTDSTLIFNEPETNAFPYYTKFLAEKIAQDKKNNQYFISTHNPYFLRSIIEKAPIGDLAIFVTYVEEYKTIIKKLDETELREILDYSHDPFFNITSYIE